MSRSNIGITKQLALMGAATATAATLTVGAVAPSAPPASAGAGIFTTGPIFGALDALGVDVEGLLPPEVQAIFDTLGVDIDNVPSNSVDINNAINGVPFTLNSRVAVVLGFGAGSYATTQAYQALIESAQGNTREGYTPLVPGPVVPILGQLTNRTNMVLVLIRNPGRPNGGLAARFSPLAEIFGIDTVTPPGGRTPNTVPGIGLNTTTVDVTWAYDILSDAPVTLNPISWANSLAASIFVTNLLGGVEVAGDNPQDIIVNAGLVLTGLVSGQSYYLTLVPDDLALLEPFRLPVRVINAVTGWNLDTPVIDAIEPAVRILVDIGYPDVVREPDGTYHRTYDTAGDPTPLLSEFPLDSPAAYLQVPVDVVRALVRGFQEEFPILAPREVTRTPSTSTSPSVVAELEDPVPAVDTSDETVADDTEAQPIATDMEPDGPEDGPVIQDRSDIRKTATEVRAKARANAQESRERVREAVRDLDGKVKKAVDNVRSAVKKAVGPKTAESRDDDKQRGKTSKVAS